MEIKQPDRQSLMKASRYLSDPDLIRVVNRLAEADLKTATGIYTDFASIAGPDEIAFLGCFDRYFLLRYLLGRKDVQHPWLYDRCREVEMEPDGHIDLWARAHYKSSTLTFAGAIQEVMRDPNVTIGIFAFNKPVAQAFLSQIKREFESNDFLREAYSDVLWDDVNEAPQWSKDRGIIVKRTSNPKEATIEAHGLVDGQPTSRHFALMIFDDVVTRESVTNSEMIRKTTEAFELADNLGTTEGARKWIIGTRYHFGDTYGTLIERGSAIPRLYPATHNGHIDGRPVFLSPETWEKKKRDQRSTIAAQMLQSPAAGNESTFRPEWFRSYEVRPAIMNVFIMVDPSLGRTKSSDRTAIAVIGMDPQKNFYLLDGYRHRMSLSERWTAVRDLYKKWSRAPGVYYVGVGYERFGQQSDLEHFKMRMEEEKIDFAIQELHWPREGGSSKKDRVGRLEPVLRNSQFFLPAAVWNPNIDTEIALWKVEEGKITYRPANITRAQRLVTDRGQPWRVVTPIKRADEDRNLYDLTREFMAEAMFFPFSPKDDLVDAVSRIFDMQAAPPIIDEHETPMPTAFEDA